MNRSPLLLLLPALLVGAKAHKSPSFPPLQLALDGFWRSDIGRVIEIRNTRPGAGSLSVWFVNRTEKHTFTLKVDPKHPQEGRLVVSPGMPYRIRRIGDGLTVKWIALFTGPEVRSIQVYTRISGKRF